jgi:hypothetical protein
MRPIMCGLPRTNGSCRADRLASAQLRRAERRNATLERPTLCNATRYQDRGRLTVETRDRSLARLGGLDGEQSPFAISTASRNLASAAFGNSRGSFGCRSHCSDRLGRPGHERRARTIERIGKQILGAEKVTSSARDCSILSSSSNGSRPSRSSLLTKVMIGTSRKRQTSKSLRVCASMPPWSH